MKALAHVLVFALLTVACSDGDRVRIVFTDPEDRAQTTRVEVLALQATRPSGEPLDCATLVGQAGLAEVRALVDETRDVSVDLSYAQRTQIAIPTPPGQNPVLVQVPQQSYLFYALALDAFGFVVARGCQRAEVQAQQRLDLAIELDSLPGTRGRLELQGPRTWLQHAGPRGAEAAPRLAVRVVDEHGIAIEHVEVRLRVLSGQAVPLNLRLRTGPDGVAQSGILAHVGHSVIEAHVRGLVDSPQRVELNGLPSPSYVVETHDLMGEPLDLAAGNFHFDIHASRDLLVLHRDATKSYSTIWIASPETPIWETTNWHELSVDAVQLAGGRFDRDDRPDFVVATDDTPPGLQMFHHRSDTGDGFRAPIAEGVPADVDRILSIRSASVDAAGSDDLIALVQSGAGIEVLVYVSRNNGPTDQMRSLAQRQRFAVPDFASDSELSSGDLDGDGDDEILLLSFISGVWIVPCGDINGTGTGRYYAPAQVGGSDWPHLFSSLGQSYVVTGEVTGDGLADIVVVNNASVVSGDVAWQLAPGDGTLQGFQLRPRVAIPIDGLEQALLADINADGLADLIVRSNTPPARVAVMGGDGLGHFAAPIFLHMGMSAVNMGVVDLNLDGINDIGLTGRTVDGSFVQGYISAGLVK